MTDARTGWTNQTDSERAAEHAQWLQDKANADWSPPWPDNGKGPPSLPADPPSIERQKAGTRPPSGNKKNKPRDTALLARIIEHSGLSITDFAEKILGRSHVTVRRWLADEMPIPKTMITWFRHWASLSDGTRARVIGALTEKPETRNSLR